ncbi:signal transduction histidine kinase [Xenococcus sp. PCC 7305]|uniref:sensor histidine kinase n=1 Tax=Xenococcus sp. PCC 7305 TaxID=102125 RepID=UPI0002AC08BC|nr:HAMP domain-containing sensor histidine kinase [Xenococcus sp. PCC 7305]ELS01318.1 signal transduction histidine kinase [Xenococcus sp. PCC 7305]
MKLLSSKLDPTSLKVRLTSGIAAFSAIGLGGLAVWTSVRMQHILVSTHKENIVYIAERFPHDVEIYSDMVSLEEGAQRAIDNLSNDNKILWIKDNNNVVSAKSNKLEDEAIATKLLSLKNVPPIPQVQDLRGDYWLLCATPLTVNGVTLGEFYIAQDITSDQIMFLNLIRSLIIATLIAIATMTITIAFYINRSMKPLKRISQITSNISADKLNEAQIHLEKAPSEVRELADTFEQMLERLAQSWEHQRQLLSNVSHELRTPLTIISGYLQSTLRRGSNLTDIQREALTTASSEADRTVQLLKDLLDLARADSGAIHFQNEKILLNDLIVDVAEMAQQYSDRHINVEAPNKSIAIEADLNRLKQVLLNLIDNAVKYSEPGTNITVKLCSKNNDAVIAVCDRGVGIPLQQQPRIFERFYRIDEARNRAGGTGLGLSIVKTLVEGMGGKITVRSQLGEGSTFTVCFREV